MTLTPLAAAAFSIAAPEPESRLTSRMIFAPLVIACSACCCCVDLSPCAFWISTGTPALSNACFRSGRSAVSQRTELWVSGSRTATFWLVFFGALLPPPPEVDDDESLLDPHAVSTRAVIASTAAITAPQRFLRLNLMVLLSSSCLPHRRVRRWLLLPTDGPRGPGRPAARRARRAGSARPRRPSRSSG